MSLFQVWTPTDLKQLQAQVLAAANTVDAAQAACGKFTASQAASWTLQLQLCKDYAAEDVGWFTSTGSTADEGQALLSQCKQYGDAVNKMCPGAITVDLDPQPSTSLQGTIGAATSLAVAVAAGIALWFVGKELTK